MKKLLAFLSVALCCCFFIADQNLYSDEAKQSVETINLLKGATLDDFGYYLDNNGVKDQVFSIKNDILRITGKPFGWLETKKSYKNFILKADFRYPEKDKAINSGIFLRINGTPVNFLPRTVEVQLCPSSQGDLYGFHDMKLAGLDDRFTVNNQHKTVKILRGIKRFQNASSDDPTVWQHIEITCYEDIIVVQLNGRIVNWATQVENTEGKIGFQSEGGLIEFRNVFLSVEKPNTK